MASEPAFIPPVEFAAASPAAKTSRESELAPQSELAVEAAEELKPEPIAADPAAEWFSSSSDSGLAEIPAVQVNYELKLETNLADAEAVTQWSSSSELKAAESPAVEAAAIGATGEAPVAHTPLETESVDDFLFAPTPLPDIPSGLRPQEAEPADFLLELGAPPAPETACAAPPQGLTAMRLEGAAEATLAAPAPPMPAPVLSAFKPRPARTLNDPLAPFRTMSDAEKIALFS
jgi:hypothetical protein